MRALRVLGIAENGTQVVCQPVADVTDTEDAAPVRAVETFALPIDERLRAAVRGDLSRIGQLEIEMESQLRPREIQQRIRAGSTIEQVAAAAGCSPDRIERYAYPVLLERSTIADRARLAHPVIDGSSAARTVEEIVAQTLGARGQQSPVTWDAFRDERGWALLATWRAGRSENRATWTYHPGPAGGTVLARDEPATMLVDPAQRSLRTVEADPVATGRPAGRPAPTPSLRSDASAARTSGIVGSRSDPTAGTPSAAADTGGTPVAGPAIPPDADADPVGDSVAHSATAVDDTGSPAGLDGSPDPSLDGDLEIQEEQRRLVADTVSDARSGSRPAAGHRPDGRPVSTSAAADAAFGVGEIGGRRRNTGTEGPTPPGSVTRTSGSGASGSGASNSGTSGRSASGGGAPASGAPDTGVPSKGATARSKRGQRPAMPSWEDVLLGTRTGR